MRISEAYGPGRFGLSFELFPPKSAAGEAELFAQLGALMAFRPDFVTCTYGAGGSTRDKTLEIVERVKREYACGVAAHLTCVGSTVDELRTYLADARQRGIGNIVALRGDPPRGEASFRPVEGGLRFAAELVRLIRGESPEFGIAVAGYPETHREAISPQDDLLNLKRKLDAGGEVVITQLFYDNDDYFRFRDRCGSLGVRAPLVPGILPVTNYGQIRRISELCGAVLPPALCEALETCGDDAAAQFEIGVEQATNQVRQLIEQGVPGVHFYVLNKSPATCRVLRQVGLPGARSRPS